MAVSILPSIVAVLFMVTPAVLAVRAELQLRAFQHEAFGHLASAARHLRLLIWAVFVYYVAVLAGSAWIGDLIHMFEWPMERAGIQIYVRIGAAILAYLLGGRVATDLYKITLPRQ